MSFLVVSVRTVINRKPRPGLFTSGSPPGNLRVALQEDRVAERLHDRQQDGAVAGVLRNLAPAQIRLLRKLFEYGHTTVNSCRMIDALMCGMMPSAKIVTFDRLPPMNMS